MGLAQHLTSFINIWGLCGMKQVSAEGQDIQVSSEGQESQASALLCALHVVLSQFILYRVVPSDFLYCRLLRYQF